MTEAKLKLGNELFEKLEKLKSSRNNYKEAFDFLCKASPEEFIPIRIKYDKVEEEKNIDILEEHIDEFSCLELRKLYEYRIKQLDIQINELQEKFDNL